MFKPFAAAIRFFQKTLAAQLANGLLKRRYDCLRREIELCHFHKGLFDLNRRAVMGGGRQFKQNRSLGDGRERASAPRVRAGITQSIPRPEGEG